MINQHELSKDINKESTRHIIELNRIADKHGIEAKELFLGDCATSTISLLIMGYGDKLTELVEHLSKKHNKRSNDE